MLLSNGSFRIEAATVLRSTERALLLSVSIVEPDPYGPGFAEYERETWIPRSLVEDTWENEDGSSSFVVPGWIARDRGLYRETRGGRLSRVWTA